MKDQNIYDTKIELMKSRSKELLREIRTQFKPFYLIWLEKVFTGDLRISYLVVTRKSSGSFIERTKEFVALLESNLIDENLVYEDKSFKVVGNGYIIQFVFEGYKRANMYGALENGKIEAKLLHRMGGFTAMDYAKKVYWSILPRIRSHMTEPEYVSQYPSPGDRFVEICKVTRKEIMNRQ